MYSGVNRSIKIPELALFPVLNTLPCDVIDIPVVSTFVVPSKCFITNVLFDAAVQLAPTLVALYRFPLISETLVPTKSSRDTRSFSLK